MEDNDLLSSALSYAQAGYAVFPCRPNEKKPATKNGYHDATTDADQIRRWWKQMPRANIGIAMRASGLVAIDPDLYKPDCGWGQFIADKELPATWEQETASGGRHFIFRAGPDDQFPGSLARHVEIKWDGYVVAAPSTFGGGTYKRVGEHAPAPAPSWLLAAEGHHSHGATGRLEWETDAHTGKVIDGRENYLTALILRHYQADPAVGAEALAKSAWREFEATVDHSRPSRMTHRDAMSKARHILKKKPTAKSYSARLIEGVPPDYTEPELSATDATAMLEATLAEFATEIGWATSPKEVKAFDAAFMRACVAADDPPRLLIRGSAGLGKSRETLKLIKARNDDLRDAGAEPTSVWYVCPTIDLAEELAGIYGAGAVVIRGRTHGMGRRGAKTPCDRPTEVLEVTRAGITNVATALCSQRIETDRGNKYVTCPFRPTCGYYRQFDRSDEAEVYFMAQQMLFVTISQQLIRKPELLIIDESLLGSLIATPRHFDPTHLRKDEIGRIIDTELRAKRDPRRALREAGHTRRSIRAHAATLEEAKPNLHPEMSLKQIRKALKGYQPPIVPRVLRKVADELPLEREGLRSLSYGTATAKLPDGVPIKVEAAYVQYRREIQQIRKQLPVLVLDATGDAELLAAEIANLREVTVAAERQAYVRQTYGFTASMHRLNGDDPSARTEISNALKEIAERHSSGLLVTYKDAEKLIQLPPGWASEHFGNLRGIDRHKDRSAIVVAGRMQIDPRAAERMAKALFYDDERQIELTGAYEKRPVGFRMRDGRHVGVLTDRHACPLVDRIRWQHTEAEMVQAVDRLRLVHRQKPADIWLLNEVPTITVDSIAPYRRAMRKHGSAGAGAGPGARLVHAYLRARHVLVARPSWLAARFPDLWRSENAARMELRDVEARGEGMKSVLPGAVAFEFRSTGQRGRSTAVWAETYDRALLAWQTEFPQGKLDA